MAIVYCSAQSEKGKQKKLITLPWKECTRHSLFQVLAQAEKYNLLILLYDGSLLSHEWVSPLVLRMNQSTAQAFAKLSSPEGILMTHDACSSMIHGFDSREKISQRIFLDALRTFRSCRWVEAEEYPARLALTLDGTTHAVEELKEIRQHESSFESGGLVFNEAISHPQIFSRYNESISQDESTAKIQELVTYFQNGNYDQGFSLLNKLLRVKNTRSMPELYVLKASIELTLGRLKEALQSILCALQHKPDDQNVRALFRQIWDAHSKVG